MRANAAGRMIELAWRENPTHYPGIGINACQVMPNHFHGIITIGMSVENPRVCPNKTDSIPPPPKGRPQGTAPYNGC
jgi:putative transposase